MEVSENLKSFIRENEQAINNFNYDELFREATLQLSKYGKYSDDYLRLIDLIKKVDLNPLEHLSQIPDKYFYNQQDLRILKLPEGIEYIKSKDMLDLSYLTTLYLPKSIIEISSLAFRYNPFLKDIFYNGTKEQWKGVLMHYKGNSYFFNCGVNCIDGKVEYYQDEDDNWFMKE